MSDDRVGMSDDRLVTAAHGVYQGGIRWRRRAVRGCHDVGVSERQLGKYGDDAKYACVLRWVCSGDKALMIGRWVR
jgi:hypothetical protein